MGMSRTEEARALDADERALVAETHHPALQALDDAALAALLVRARERRDRAQDLAKRRRREMRGKAAPRGAEASRADAGSKAKAAALAAAVKRLNAEAERRRRMRARLTLVESQRRALAMVRAEGAPDHAGLNTRTAHDGMRAKPVAKHRRPGSAREAGRVSQFVRDAQAKRDAR
jgi:hypothetical protein